MKNAKIPRAVFIYVLLKSETLGSFNINLSPSSNERFLCCCQASSLALKILLFVSTVYEKFGINLATAKMLLMQEFRVACSL